MHLLHLLRLTKYRCNPYRQVQRVFLDGYGDDLAMALSFLAVLVVPHVIVPRMHS